MTVPVLVLLGLLVPMLLIALTNLVSAPRLHAVRAREVGPRVSVLVPARDEADHLRRLLPALGQTRYRDLEVIVLDDGSRDETRAVANRHAGADPRFRVITGSEPPSSWTGKSWACHQLAAEARGNILIFCDADVLPGPEAVGRTAAALDGADVLTAFPRHETGGWFEDAVIPMVAKLPIAALLPLALVARTRAPSLAVGNGQWLAFNRFAYRAVGGHARVRGDVLEDMALARAAKEDGLILSPFLATRDLRVRMYEGTAQTWEGFSKNLYRLAGGSDRTAIPTLLVFLAVALGPVVLPVAGGPLAWTPLGVLILIRLTTAALFRDRLGSVLLHPIGVVATAGLLLDSRRRHRQGAVVWKRRTVPAGR